MPSVTTIHHPLGRINSTSGQVRSSVDVDDLIDRPAVDSYAKAEILAIFQRFADFYSASRRCFRTGKENQHHPVARGQSNEFAGSFGRNELLGLSDDLIESICKFALLIDQEFRKADDIHEQDMPDFELSITFPLSSHVCTVTRLTDNHFNSDPP